MSPEDIESIKRKCESPFAALTDFRDDIDLLIAEVERLTEERNAWRAAWYGTDMHVSEVRNQAMTELYAMGIEHPHHEARMGLR